MYSTDGGEILFHTKSHFSKLAVFFPMMILIAFFNIRYWHTFAYVFYFLIILKICVYMRGPVVPKNRDFEKASVF